MIRVALLLFALAMSISSANAMGICGGGKRSTCVVDGDTLWLNGEKIRLMSIDAPEISQPGCSAELERGLAARDALLDLMNSGEISIQRDGHDRYGRTLANVYVAGRDVASDLIRTGLAREYSGRHQGWCG